MKKICLITWVLTLLIVGCSTCMLAQGVTREMSGSEDFWIQSGNMVHPAIIRDPVPLPIRPIEPIEPIDPIDPGEPPVPTIFDWTNPAHFVDWSGNPLPNLWLAENHYGVDLSNANRCPVSEGWNLYFKRLTPQDQGIYTKTTTNTNTYYFVLYNKHTGVLRVFLFLKGDNYSGEDTFSFSMSLVDGSNNAKNIGLFLNDAEISLASNLADKSATFNKDRVAVLEAYYNKWFVVDYLLSYDPTLATSQFTNTYLKIDIRAHSKMNINLGGTFEFDVNDVLTGKNSLVSSIIDSVLDIGGQISKRVSSVEDLAEGLDKDGDKLIERSNGGLLIDAGLALKHAAITLNPLSGMIGLGLGAFDIISGFTNITGTSKQTHVMYGKGTINLDGTITNSFPKTFIKMGIPGVQYNESLDASKYSGKIGLFSLKRKPVMELHLHRTIVTVYDYWGRPVNTFNRERLGWNPYEDFFRIVEINPETNMELVQVRIAPVLVVNCDSYTASYQFNSQYFNVDGSGPYTFSYKQMTDPDHFYRSDIRDEWVCGRTDSYGGSSVVLSKAYYKIYMLFQHKVDPTIKMEVMRTYEAAIDMRLEIDYDSIQE